MNGFRFNLPRKSVAKLCLTVTLVSAPLFQPVFAGPIPTKDAEGQSSSADRGSSTQIECITPDGRLTPVVSDTTSNPRPPAFLAADNTISCDLQEGDTVFIIPVAATARLDRFTFVNHNPAASGEFNIALANSRLAPESPRWVQVDGIVPFAHKRLFNLSLLGTGAKYIKLSFHVERISRLTRVSSDASAQRQPTAIEPAPPAAGPADD